MNSVMRAFSAFQFRVAEWREAWIETSQVCQRSRRCTMKANRVRLRWPACGAAVAGAAAFARRAGRTEPA